MIRPCFDCGLDKTAIKYIFFCNCKRFEYDSYQRVLRNYDYYNFPKCDNNIVLLQSMGENEKLFLFFGDVQLNTQGYSYDSCDSLTNTYNQMRYSISNEKY